jgi:hypothetical protein
MPNYKSFCVMLINVIRFHLGKCYQGFFYLWYCTTYSPNLYAAIQFSNFTGLCQLTICITFGLPDKYFIVLIMVSSVGWCHSQGIDEAWECCKGRMGNCTIWTNCRSTYRILLLKRSGSQWEDCVLQRFNSMCSPPKHMVLYICSVPFNAAAFQVHMPCSCLDSC